MKKKLMRLAAVGLICAMTGGLAACGSSKTAGTGGSSGSEKKSATTVGIVVKTATNAHFQDIAYGAVLAGKDLGINVKVDNTSTESDVEGQVTKCENMISSGVDALILTANDSDGVSNAVAAAHDAKIPFVTVDTKITNQWGDDVKEYMPNYIGVDHEKMAYELAKNVFKKMGSKGQVVILRGVDAASSSQERTAGFKRALKEYPNIKLVESQSAKYDQDTAASTMADIIQAHPKVKAVLCCNDLMAAGAVTALEENNIKVGGDNGVLVAGIDGNYIALQSIDDSKIYATAYDWSILQGYYAVEQAYDLIQGKNVPEETMTPDTIITKENVDDYLEHGKELSQWTMGQSISKVSDYMRNFVTMGEKMKTDGTASSSSGDSSASKETKDAAEK